MESPKQLWQEKGAKNPYYWILTNNESWDKDEFFKQGEKDIEQYVVPFLRQQGITPDQARSMKALDIGCGAGRLTRALGQLFGSVLGVDISPTMIEKAKQDNADVSHLSFLEVSGDGDLGGVADASIDFCFSFITFQHMLRKSIIPRYFKSIARVLKPGAVGKIQVRGNPGNPPGKVIWFHGFENRYIAIVLWRRWLPLLWTRAYRDLYGACFTASEVQAIAKAAGLTVLSVDQETLRHLWITFKK